jgi:AcrR family transcriptional regulator
MRVYKHTFVAAKTPPLDSAARRIIDTARQHFFTRGFRAVTMDEIAAELGMSKKTLYACFASKNDIVRAVLLNKFQSIDVDLGAITSADSGDVMATLHRLLLCLRQHTQEIHPAFVRDLRREAPELFKLVEGRRRELIKRYFGGLFAEGRKAGLFRNDIANRLIVEILLGATEAILNPAKMAELGITPKTGLMAILSVILEGVITTKARGQDRPKAFKTSRRALRHSNSEFEP